MSRFAKETKVAVVGTIVADMDDFSFTEPYVDQARAALVSTYDERVLITFDGTDPVAASGLGHVVSTTGGNWYLVEGGENVQNLKLVRDSADAKVTITLLR